MIISQMYDYNYSIENKKMKILNKESFLNPNLFNGLVLDCKGQPGKS